jgi:hypothetical protein
MTYLREVTPSDRPVGEEPMSRRQAHILRRLCDEAGDPRVFDPGLSRHRAEHRIATLRDEIRMNLLPPHTD